MLEIYLEIEISPACSSCYIPVKKIESFCKTEQKQDGNHDYQMWASVDLYINGNYHFKNGKKKLFLFSKKPESGKASPLNINPVVGILHD
jgi:hypothetical protein